MNRTLATETVEGEIALVIQYAPGQSKALDVLGGAMSLIAAIDALDTALLSSISTELEPVSILNDVQHSSLKVLLARALRSLPDDPISTLDWKKWVGGLLVKGKYRLLGMVDADAPQIEAVLQDLAPDYRHPPGVLAGYEPPKVKGIQAALGDVAKARSSLGSGRVTVQTELGDIDLPDGALEATPRQDEEVVTTRVNRGREFLKVRYPDMLGTAQWTVMRGGKSTRVDVLHKTWLDDYHARQIAIAPGDSLDCSYEETVSYDASNTEVERRLSVTEVHGVTSPPRQQNLF